MELAVPLQKSPLMLITDRHRTRGRDIGTVVRDAIGGGCRWIMFREPDLSDLEFYDECVKMRELCEDGAAGMIVNDRLDVAALVRAQGVHIGRNDLPVRVVKEYMGEDFLVGYSAHTEKEAVTAAWDGADYITYSPIFPLEHKESAYKPHGPEGAMNILEKVDIPVFFLGGIRLSNLSALEKEVSPLRVASVSMLSEAKSVTAATEEVLRILGTPEWHEEDPKA